MAHASGQPSISVLPPSSFPISAGISGRIRQTAKGWGWVTISFFFSFFLPRNLLEVVVGSSWAGGVNFLFSCQLLGGFVGYLAG
ncbi:uncharacterized protein B0H64DRAFT_384352 [Chaetomium fimeti]|uniref:Uncharacterized protein n=1 Tax=Chaetomium fimeti TaxID=1854472 RepID=A0AAE0LVA6_9PEZI|nr:hypothetical protein B0H64DRAFT_384352 [Chaetomium fimeti]